MSLIGFDDSSFNTLLTPPLTAIRQPVEQLGRQGFQALIAQINGEKPPLLTRLPVELMEAYGRKRAGEGFTHVVFGHFHHKLVLPAGDATVAVLPAWYESREALMIAPDTGEFQFVKI